MDPVLSQTVTEQQFLLVESELQGETALNRKQAKFVAQNNLLLFLSENENKHYTLETSSFSPNHRGSASSSGHRQDNGAIDYLVNAARRAGFL